LDEDAQAEAVAEQQEALNAPEVSIVSEEKPTDVVMENVGQPGATPHIEVESEPKETLQSIAASVTDNSVAPVEEKPAATANGIESEEVAPAPQAAKEEAAPAPVPQEAVATPAPAQTPAAPAPSVPAAPKTWANLAASGASKWGSNVSAETRASSSARPAVSSSPAISSAPASRPAVSTGPKPSASNPSVFIKSVNLDHMTAEELRETLETTYGKLRECSVIPTKACAFAEFVNQDHARKAVADSLPKSQGGNGGLLIGKKNWLVTVEEKRGAGQKPMGANRGGRGGAQQGSNRNGARTNAPRGRTQA